MPSTTLTKIEITSGAVEASRIHESFNNPQHGGQAFFFGAVRNFNHGKPVKAVSYDCYDQMAVPELKHIVFEARAKWGEDLDFVIFHGTGRIEVGQFSVGIGVSSPHRDEAFQACRYVIEELKVRVPIWKQEHYLDGDSEWLKGHELCQHGKVHENHSHDSSGRP